MLVLEVLGQKVEFIAHHFINAQPLHHPLVPQFSDKNRNIIFILTIVCLF